MPSSSPPPEPTGETATVRCPGCQVEGRVAIDSWYECSLCGALFDPAKHLVRAHHVRRGMLDKLTGMRVRRREGMGFKKGGFTAVSAAHDSELSGRKLEKLSGQWQDTTLQPWDDVARPEPPARKWLDGRLGPALLGVMLTPVLLFWGWRLWRGDDAIAPPLPAADADRRSDFDRNLDNKVKRAERTALQFLSAGNVETLLPLVRDRARVEPAILAWYRDAPPFSAALRDIKLHSAAMLPDSIFLRLVAETEDFRHVVVTLEETPDGWLVDWESFVAWSAVSWEDLAKGHSPDGKPALVRGYLTLADWYEPPFSPEKHQSCTLRNPGGAQVLPAWMEADPLSLMLLRGAFFDAGTTEIEIIARVQPAPGGTSGRLHVTEILQTGWILWSGSPGYSGVLFKSRHELEPEAPPVEKPAPKRRK